MTSSSQVTQLDRRRRCQQVKGLGAAMTSTSRPAAEDERRMACCEGEGVQAYAEATALATKIQTSMLGCMVRPCGEDPGRLLR